MKHSVEVLTNQLDDKITLIAEQHVIIENLQTLLDATQGTSANNKAAYRELEEKYEVLLGKHEALLVYRQGEFVTTENVLQ